MKRIIAIAFALALGSAFAAGGLVRGAAARGASLALLQDDFRQYATDGLICIFDCKSSPTAGGKLYDWLGSLDYVDISSIDFSREGLHLNNTYCTNTVEYTVVTHEIVFSIPNKEKVSIYSLSLTELGSQSSSYNPGWGRKTSFWYQPYSDFPINKIQTASLVCPNTVYLNGDFSFSSYSNPASTGIVKIGSTQMGAKGESTILCVRLYNRALTADEIAHNYAVDKARFNLP